jgi:hypothetical protein
LYCSIYLVLFLINILHTSDVKISTTDLRKYLEEREAEDRRRIEEEGKKEASSRREIQEIKLNKLTGQEKQTECRTQGSSGLVTGGAVGGGSEGGHRANNHSRPGKGECGGGSKGHPRSMVPKEKKLESPYGGDDDEDDEDNDSDDDSGNGKDCVKEDTDTDTDDSVGEMKAIIRFFPSQKKFLLLWSKRKEPEKQGAAEVFEDWPDRALFILWRDHQDNVRIRDWANRMMRVNDPDFKGIEQYAKDHNWLGSIEIPHSASIPKRQRVVDEVEESPEKKTKTIRVEESPTKRRKTIPVEESPKKIMKTIPVVQMVSGGANGSIVTITPSTSSVKVPNQCKVIHKWVELFAPGFKCLDGQSCMGTCGLKFMKGKKNPNVKGFWPSRALVAYWCEEPLCGMTMCEPCKRKKDLDSPPPNKRRLRN